MDLGSIPERPWRKPTGARGELGCDAVTPEASANGPGSSAARGAVGLPGVGVRPLYTHSDRSLDEDDRWKVWPWGGSAPGQAHFLQGPRLKAVSAAPDAWELGPVQKWVRVEGVCQGTHSVG